MISQMRIILRIFGRILKIGLKKSRLKNNKIVEDGGIIIYLIFYCIYLLFLYFLLYKKYFF